MASEEMSFENVDGTTTMDGRRMPGSSELKIQYLGLGIEILLV